MKNFKSAVFLIVFTLLTSSTGAHAERIYQNGKSDVASVAEFFPFAISVGALTFYGAALTSMLDSMLPN